MNQSLQAELDAVVDDPGLDASDKIEALQRTWSAYRHCTPAENAALIEEMFGKVAAPAQPTAKPVVECNWLTPSAACVHAKFSKQTLWRWKKEGLVTGRGGRVLQSVLDAWLADDATPESDAGVDTEWLTLKQAAARASCSKMTICRWGNAGLRIVRRGLVVRIRADVLDRYLQKVR